MSKHICLKSHSYSSYSMTKRSKHWPSKCMVTGSIPAYGSPQLAGEACQLGCPKIVLDHVGALYIFSRQGSEFGVAMAQSS